MNASAWALPPYQINVVNEVWEEVQAHAPGALQYARVQRVTVSGPISEGIARWNLDRGELASLQFALSQPREQEILILCDERQARRVCKEMALPVVGSIGLIVEAFRAGRVAEDIASQALRDLPDLGRLHVVPHLIEMALAALKQ